MGWVWAVGNIHERKRLLTVKERGGRNEECRRAVMGKTAAGWGVEGEFEAGAGRSRERWSCPH